MDEELTSSSYVQNKIEFHTGTTQQVQPSPTPQITFTFSVKSVTCEWLDSSPPTLLSETRADLATISVYVPLGPAFSYQEAYADVRELIEGWPVSDDVDPHTVASCALSHALRQVRNAPPDHDVFVDVHVAEFRHDSALEFEPADEQMVPADDSAVEALETTRVESEICSVCYEEVFEGTLMPCMHVFHGDCIREWLRTSHYCPNCRFQMPTRT